ncbi:hypothetical protein JCM9140_1768 [Halalkalibacter wakoensis JCM 9140]|uniref:DUF418 domain-containing protein n=1 Tax=Halalkalibacter wakoensis JCM 9140 TaxID=1236970 RepID=W4Q308_9BACI|nr:DUF418 domain-containing protein [Halalkalibacter wakoensis]GAE25759.1 hypothetical protein JCM9140_1768 [Halalkalibacter wakoensis JCM 9140]
MSTKPRPLHEEERILSLDVMRGFALLGILLANSLHFQYGLFVIPEIHNLYPLGPLDQIAESFILLFTQASFYTLFSFLFGYGMAFLKERLEQKNLHFGAVYWRRTFILLVVGYVHGLFIWDGDILFVYALTAFVLFFFLKLRSKTLFIWSFLLLFLMALSIGTPEDEASTSLDNQLLSYSTEEKDVLSTGSYAEVVSFRLHADPLGLGVMGDIIINATSMVSVLGMFLLGAFVARKKWLVNLHDNRKLFVRVWWTTLLIGFPSKLPYLFSDRYAFEMLHMTIGGPFVAMFYASSIALLCTNERSLQILRPLTYVGRLSLTNYLTQSLVFTTLFYGYGFGLFSSIGVFAAAILVFVFFALQIVVSKWWLRHFYIGPFEWFWRWATYLSIPKFRR